ncbi:PREDICTED: probably inactive leucine-rich repeat receptor-like protein kinase At2g25790 isoform X2 [Theobroma cacao]|uniref:Probably inactive leucine-rich repeat receptor-like protein kinase At2g25790 isoform X2 n=1 Tax=Theobroma cacao TaxID=3641 RepID=A0AB32WN37_THECC|nr:PREDICTED: probably inactive leucine-rich repeat receptor-like protein kinase At2g25790 isoform X2 [Theobroma cacao]
MSNKEAKAHSLLFMFMFLFVLNFSLSQVDDLELLLSFKSSINDPSGFLSNWNSSTPLCMWHGITCNNFSRVKVIDLVKKNISGIISSSIFHLVEIETINLSNNQLLGEIPKDLASSVSLLYLNFSNNHLTGEVPKFSFSLEILDLWGNLLSGKIPSQIGACSNLQELDLGGNNLEGRIPSCISNISRLQILTLACNKLVGRIPRALTKMKSLKWISFGYNNFSGEIPQELVGLVSLSFLDLAYNNLSGQIPSSLGNLTNLQHLLLFGNKLTGPIPQGKQFNTFENGSYEGNLALCGFPLLKACNNDGRKQSPSFLKEADDSETKINFGWKVVLIGYGCGLIFGVVVGYVTFKNGEPKWFVTLYHVKYHGKGRR